MAYDSDLGPQAAPRRRLQRQLLRLRHARSAVRQPDGPSGLCQGRRLEPHRHAQRRTPATSMIPAGVPGRDDIDHKPTYDPEAARQLLADANYPGGAGFPTSRARRRTASAYEETVAAELEQNLGVQVKRRGPGLQRLHQSHARPWFAGHLDAVVERRLSAPARLPGPAARDGQHQQRWRVEQRRVRRAASRRQRRRPI